MNVDYSKDFKKSVKKLSGKMLDSVSIDVFKLSLLLAEIRFLIFEWSFNNV